jgi:hypothetical protein
MESFMDELRHFGTPRHSGRYPWGSGGEDDSFVGEVERLMAQGLTETEIAEGLEMSTGELRNQKQISKLERTESQRLWVSRQSDGGMSVSAIAKEGGLSEYAVRSLLKPHANLKYRVLRKIVDVLKHAVERFGFVDVGEGTEHFMDISRTKLLMALTMMKNEGFKVHYLRETQLGTGKKTSIMVLTGPDKEWKDVLANRDNIGIARYDGTDTKQVSLDRVKVRNMDSSRLKVVYADEGGADKDGLIELRTGVPELSLGKKRYAQVRIGVDDTHYLKGMAIHKDDMPDGVDMIFYTSKNRTDNMLDALKPQDPNGINPFGSAIKNPRTIIGPDGKEQLSALNFVYEEGDWSKWSDSLSSQFLSKQSPQLAAQQLKKDFENRVSEYDEIMSLTNEVVKAHLLNDFSQSTDANTTLLKAAAMPNQRWQVLVPEPSMKPNEIYAPNYKDGDRLTLVRYPHGGIFELPTLVVNNKNPNMKKTIGSAPDAVAIHPDVAQRLSGADFDGDTVMTIPSSPQIRTAPALEGLKNFNPRDYQYPLDANGDPPKGARLMTSEGTQLHMGNISNLITDMTIQGAPPQELARAVRHSMVVIDAEKHRLNWQESSRVNGISALKKRYQGGATKGAATIVSRAKSPEYVPHRKDYFTIDPATGKKVYQYTGESYISKKTGEIVERRTRSTKMAEEDDAHNLSSGTRIERVYADYANQMKGLANQARKSMIETTPQKAVPSARKMYADAVASLDRKLVATYQHAPLERKAQLIAGTLYRSKISETPGMSRAQKKDARARALGLARARVGVKKPIIDITDREWEAIQMGAVSPTKLRRILQNADADRVRMLATPRAANTIPGGKENRIRTLLELGYTQAEVAQAVGVSVSQINNLDD